MQAAQAASQARLHGLKQCVSVPANKNRCDGILVVAKRATPRKALHRRAQVRRHSCRCQVCNAANGVLPNRSPTRANATARCALADEALGVGEAVVARSTVKGIPKRWCWAGVSWSIRMPTCLLIARRASRMGSSLSHTVMFCWNLGSSARFIDCAQLRVLVQIMPTAIHARMVCLSGV